MWMRTIFERKFDSVIADLINLIDFNNEIWEWLFISLAGFEDKINRRVSGTS